MLTTYLYNKPSETPWWCPSQHAWACAYCRYSIHIYVRSGYGSFRFIIITCTFTSPHISQNARGGGKARLFAIIYHLWYIYVYWRSTDRYRGRYVHKLGVRYYRTYIYSIITSLWFNLYTYLAGRTAGGDARQVVRLQRWDIDVYVYTYIASSAQQYIYIYIHVYTYGR